MRIANALKAVIFDNQIILKINKSFAQLDYSSKQFLSWNVE